MSLGWWDDLLQADKPRPFELKEPVWIRATAIASSSTRRMLAYAPQGGVLGQAAHLLEHVALQLASIYQFITQPCLIDLSCLYRRSMLGAAFATWRSY